LEKRNWASHVMTFHPRHSSALEKRGSPAEKYANVVDVKAQESIHQKGAFFKKESAKLVTGKVGSVFSLPRSF
jgi:hypothetical protein